MNKFFIISFLFGFCKAQQHLSENKILVEELRIALANDKNDDFELKEYTQSYLNKAPDELMSIWLEYFEYNLDKAKDGIIKSLRWRLRNNIDEILYNWEPLEYIKKDFRYLIVKNTEGPSLVYVPYSTWKLRKAIQNGDRNELLKYHITILNTADTLPLSLGANAKYHGVILIADMKDISIYELSSMRVLSIVTYLAVMYQNYYPLHIKAAYVINAPSFISILMDIVKRVINAKTLNTIHVYPDYPQELIENIFLRKDLPVDLGGDIVY